MRRSMLSSLGVNTAGTLQPSYQWLAEIYRRLETIRSIINLIAWSLTNSYRHPRAGDSWERLVTVGLHLSYRLYDCHSYSGKAEFIESLPLTSLAIIYATIRIILFPARSLNKDIMNPLYESSATIPTEQYRIVYTARLFREGSLFHGPEFIRGILDPEFDKHRANSIFRDDWQLARQSESNDNGDVPQHYLNMCLMTSIHRRLSSRTDQIWDEGDGMAFSAVPRRELLETLSIPTLVLA